MPELSYKPTRSLSLPEKTELLDWAKNTQKENLSLLGSALVNDFGHELLEDSYLVYFLIQHYSQHIETMHMILTEIQLQQLSNDFLIIEN